MKTIITNTLALFFFLIAGTASAATTDFSANGFKSIQSDMICAEEKKDKKKKKGEEEEEPECD